MYLHHMASHTHHNIWVRCALLYIRSAGYLVTDTVILVSVLRQCLETTTLNWDIWAAMWERETINPARLLVVRSSSMSERKTTNPAGLHVVRSSSMWERETTNPAGLLVVRSSSMWERKTTNPAGLLVVESSSCYVREKETSSTADHFAVTVTKMVSLMNSELSRTT